MIQRKFFPQVLRKAKRANSNSGGFPSLAWGRNLRQTHPTRALCFRKLLLSRCFHCGGRVVLRTPPTRERPQLNVHGAMRVYIGTQSWTFIGAIVRTSCRSTSLPPSNGGVEKPAQNMSGRRPEAAIELIFARGAVMSRRRNSQSNALFRGVILQFRIGATS